MYENVQALDRQVHSAVRLPNQPVEFGFAATLNSVLLLGIEFLDAARSYPILFVRDPSQNILPIALLGLRPNHNLFVENGRWAVEHYIPAFLRRFPLILTKEGTVAIDTDFAAGGEGEALFAEDGANTPALDRALAFLAQYQAEGDRTTAFVAKLTGLDLLKSWNMRFSTASGESFGFDDCLVVDDKKLSELGDDLALSLFRTGELAWIHAHFVSLGGLGALASRLTPAPVAADAQSPDAES